MTTPHACLAALLTLALAPSYPVPAQASHGLVVEWARQFDGATSAPGLTGDGTGVYVGGDVSQIGGHDAVVRKYDHVGNEVWTRQFGTAAQDGVLDVAIDASGVYAVGSFRPFQPDASAFVRKFDANGNLLWSDTFTGSGSSPAEAFAVSALPIEFRLLDGFPASMGRVFVGGRFGLVAAVDGFLRRYSHTGDRIWTATAAVRTVHAVSALPAGVHVLVGPSKGSLQTRLEVYDLDGVFLAGIADIPGATDVAATPSGVYVCGHDGSSPFLKKFAVLGGLLWTRSFVPAPATFVGGGLACAADASRIFVVGRPGGLATKVDTFVQTFDPQGNALSTLFYGSTDRDCVAPLAEAVATTPAGTYVSGWTEENIPGIPRAGCGVKGFVFKLARFLVHFSLLPLGPDDVTDMPQRPAPINPFKKGLIPTAILTSSTEMGEALDFDAREVDPRSVAFGPAGAEPRRSALEDVDGDGDLDLVLHFRTQDTGIACGDEAVLLNAHTVGNAEVDGAAPIRTVGCE